MITKTLHLKDYYDFLSENSKDATVDMYLPYNMTEMKRENIKRPTMIVCPGGGYGYCSQREAEPIATHFLPYGFNVFVLYYSVAPHRFPSQMLETAALMELLYKNSDEWNIDTDKISIIGFSAGGHLAAHYSTMFDCKEVRKYFPLSKNVNASVLCYPVISAISDKSHFGSIENLLGHLPATDEEAKYFSCEYNVKPTTPPTFIWHTSEDGCVPVENSLLYAKSLAENNVKFELHIYPYGGHGLSTADSQTNGDITEKIEHVSQWTTDVIKWFKLIYNFK